MSGNSASLGLRGFTGKIPMNPYPNLSERLSFSLMWVLDPDLLNQLAMVYILLNQH